MSVRQITLPDLPLRIELRGRTATVRSTGSTPGEWKFRLRRVHDLTTRLAESEIVPSAPAEQPPLLVHFDNASPQAKAVLRKHQISFLGEGGECFLFAPPLVVDRESPRAYRQAGRPTAAASATLRNPFARNASRALRLLLLQPDREFSIGELARAAELSDALVSRVVHSLHEDSWVDVDRDQKDSRYRRVRIARPREALSAWATVWRRRRVQVEHWDIRTENPNLTMRRLRETRKRRPGLHWAVGGISGASLIQRVVEPANVWVWVSEDEISQWEKMLLPTRTARGQASLSLAVAPDDFTLGLATECKGLPVADPVQLWLDCSREGERALDAADAIAERMGW